MARIFLAMNGKRINTLDDLRSNFNGKQMLSFYRAGRLQKWLEELGENDLLETVRDFQNENYDDETLLSMLMASFELDDQQIAEVHRSVEQEKAEQTEKPPEGEAHPATDVPASEGPETCWYCEGKGYHILGQTCPICHGEKVSVLPQWLKMIRDNEVSKEDKLRNLAREVLKVINDAIANCDDLSAIFKIGLYEQYKECGLSEYRDKLFFHELSLALNLNFGNTIRGPQCSEWNKPFNALLVIAEKYLPETCKGGFGERLDFKARYGEMLSSEFGR